MSASAEEAVGDDTGLALTDAEIAAATGPPQADPPDRDAGLRALMADLARMIDLAAVGLEPAEAQYHVVVIPDGGDHATRTFPDGPAAAAFLRGLYGQDVRVEVFAGRRCRITRPPARYLCTPEGRLPLFAEDGGDEIDESGSLAPLGATPGMAVPPPAPPAAADDEDDEDDDEEGEGDGDEDEADDDD